MYNKLLPKNQDKLLDILALCICLASLIFCLVISFLREVGTFAVETDFYGVYAVEATNILMGKAYTYQHNPPGYCLLLAAVTYVSKDIFLAGKLISAFATAIFTLVNYSLFKYLFNPKISLLVTIISLLALIPSSLVASTDVLGATLIILSIWLYLGHQFLFFSGIIAGIAYLVRANTIFVSVGIIITLILINPQQQTLVKRFLSVALFLMGLFLILTPWLIYNWQINGSPFASTAYTQIAAHFYHSQGDSFITSVQEMGNKFNSLTDVIFYQPLTLLQRYFKDIFFVNIASLLVSNFLITYLSKANLPWYYIVIITLPALIIFSIGIITLLTDKVSNTMFKARITLLVINLLGYLILGLVGFSRRYYLFLLPCLFLIIIYPVYNHKIFPRFLKWRLFKCSISKILISFLIFSLTISAILQTYYLLATEPKYLLEIASFLKQQSQPNQVIIVRKPHLAYLSGLKPIFPLAETPEQYLLEAHKNQAKFVVYSDYEAKIWPGLNSLKYPQKLPQNFILIYHHQASNTLIYGIF